MPVTDFMPQLAVQKS